jgi:polyhydroxyalkanoate synthase subunit PhaC
MAALPAQTAMLDRLRRDVERNALRARNGLKHLSGVGRAPVGVSPKDVVWERDKVQLYRYRSDRRTVTPPLLLIMSLVSKPYVLDLRPGNSFVESLIGRGFDVFMLDWGSPDAAESANTFETYCDEYMPFACAAALRTSHAAELHVFGYCFGGVLSLMFAAGHPELPLRSLSIMATPIDFGPMGGMIQLLRDPRTDIGTLLDETGNVPAATMLRGVSMTKVTGDLSTYASLLASLDKSDYVAAHEAMHGWAHDHIPFPGACFRQMVEWIVRENRLAENRVVTSRGALDFTSIACPVMNAVGTSDHIVPIESNRPVLDIVPHVDDLAFDAGHVGLILGRRAHSVSIPGMIDWIAQHSDVVEP